MSQKPDPNMQIGYDVWNVKTYDYSIKIQIIGIYNDIDSLTAIFLVF